ncbi:MAG: hypothetical protein V1779_14325 [bacterium]
MTDSTPFFANDAELLLKSRMFDKAISMCKNGVAQYPLYLSGWIILINALKSAGQIDEAKNSTNYALKIFPENKTLNFLKEEFEDIFYEVVYNNKDMDNNIEEINTEFSTLENILEENMSGKENFGNNLQDIAKKLAEVSEPSMETNLSKESQNPLPIGIISETIAKIYISQGAFSEAITAYKNLITINPDRKTFYLEKISELEAGI